MPQGIGVIVQPGERVPLSLVPHQETRHLPVSGGACAAFTGECGSSCACEIYEQRPRACHDFKPGSVHCTSARARLVKDLLAVIG